MKQFLTVATGGAGGDLQALVAAALAVRGRGHRIAFLGDRSVGRALSALGVDVQVLPPELDLGPRLAGAVREAMVATGDDIVGQARSSNNDWHSGVGKLRSRSAEPSPSGGGMRS